MKKFLSDDALSWKTEVGRNTFDISKKHFASYNFGKIYPMYLRHVQPNETIKIRPHMEMELEPLNHELYNDIKCNTAYFYVRTRSLWSSWRKYVRQDPTKDSNIVHPYVAQDNWLSVGSLGNHLGIPINSYGVFDGNTQTSFTQHAEAIGSVAVGNTRNLTSILYGGETSLTDLDVLQSWNRRDFNTLLIQPSGNLCFAPVVFSAEETNSTLKPSLLFSGLSNGVPQKLPLGQQLISSLSSSSHTHAIVIGGGINTLVSDDFHLFLPHVSSIVRVSGTDKDFTYEGDLKVFLYAGPDLSSAVYVGESELSKISNSSKGHYTLENKVSRNIQAYVEGVTYSTQIVTLDYNLYFSDIFTSLVQTAQQNYSNVYFVIAPSSVPSVSVDSNISSDVSAMPNFAVHGLTAASPILTTVGQDTILQIRAGFYGFPRYSSQSEINSVVYSPFEGVSPDLPLSVLPFRAYRNIYNSHFRDLIHDPLRDGNGDIMTDQYVENMGDGPDTTTKLDFEFCRFEPDLFNTCLPSPTMGDDVNRPLVGITASSDPDTYTLNYNSDGVAYTIDVKANPQSGSITDMVSTTHSEGVNNLTYLTLKDAINYGISLQDLQNVRALTKWYEASYRGKGRFEYDKFVEAHFGKQPALRENLAAEYLGGETTFVNSFKVINQSADGVQPLGAMAGLANFSAKEDPISCYCDEDGYIMGVVWFTCDNVNTQSIDKLWYLSQPCDYSTPEFADLGVQAITMKEFLPLQTPLANANDVFGYQRIYGDKIYAFDSVAGDFLTDKASYLMQRRFDGSESLTADFSKMKPEEFTNVFAFDNTLDKIYGKWYFDTTISTWLQQTPNVQII